MITITLRENVVSDDVVHIADNNKVFKGNYVAILEYNTYKNAWQDEKHYKRFRKFESLNNYINKNYKKFAKHNDILDFITY